MENSSICYKVYTKKNIDILDTLTDSTDFVLIYDCISMLMTKMELPFHIATW